ncbi:MAG TPA: HD domain-containing protein [Thermoplasmata archaeon]|nr:HD domain-containing protein [Thermoplasmata archaeon]
MGGPSEVRKSIFDPVHGIVDLDGVALELIAHPAFQRLWGIRQTGFAHLVFPGANHTRLEHSLGVFWVARQMARALALGPDDLATVTSGALLHDLGHGPFSHTLDPTMEEVLGYGHERISRERILGRVPEGGHAEGGAARLPEILERHGLAPLRVAALVDPARGRSAPLLLRSILHGPIDADRIDYLQRDAHYTGVAHGAIDAVRLLATVRAYRSRLAFAEKGRSAVEGFLVGRALMYASVYYHKTVRAAEVMAQAAVERVPGFPEAARPLFPLVDGELLVRLREVGGRSERLIRDVTERRLFKRAHGWRVLDASRRRAFDKLRRDPPARRAWEDAFAARLDAPPGSVLLDLAGLTVRDSGGLDWSDVGIFDGPHLSRPFRPDGPWSMFTDRPPAMWAVSIYVDPRRRARAEDLFRRGRGLPD